VNFIKQAKLAREPDLLEWNRYSRSELRKASEACSGACPVGGGSGKLWSGMGLYLAGQEQPHQMTIFPISKNDPRKIHG
jgi:hypothetical protein